VFITGTTLSSVGLQAANEAHTARAAKKRIRRLERIKTASASNNARHSVTITGKGVAKQHRFKASANDMIRPLASEFPDGDFAGGKVLRLAH
jgi:hypothetical protein